MPTWNSRGLRGSTLEELVNLTNELYTEKNLALMQKIPTPITPDQIHFMRQFEKQRGISFLLVMFTARNEFYYLRLCELETYLARAEQGHARNFKYEELNPAYFIKSQSGAPIHYLKGLQLDLQERED